MHGAINPGRTNGCERKWSWQRPSQDPCYLGVFSAFVVRGIGIKSHPLLSISTAEAVSNMTVLITEGKPVEQ
jgi:hypothetical protein